MEENLITRLARVKFFIDYINAGGEAFTDKNHPKYRQSTVDTIFFTFSRLKQEILEERNTANDEEKQKLDELMMDINDILAVFEPIAAKNKTEGGGSRGGSRGGRSKRRKRGKKRKSKRR